MNKRSGAQNTGKTIKRLLSYIGQYKFRFIVVLICIILSAVANVAGSMFIRTLIDDYITPLLSQTNPVFTGLLKAILIMGFVYLVGILATLFYNRIMVSISQGIQKTIR
ncbi:MAG: ABC transporter ATP-binding protein, partial [Hominilimicola sp.]